MSPTTIDGLPPVIACASSAWIWRMSHWSPDRLSESVAGAFGSPPGAASAKLLSCGDSRVAKPSVAAAPSTRESPSTPARNDGLSERAMATPICG